jgi:hypothetical protein
VQARLLNCLRFPAIEFYSTKFSRCLGRESGPFLALGRSMNQNGGQGFSSTLCVAHWHARRLARESFGPLQLDPFGICHSFRGQSREDDACWNTLAVAAWRSWGVRAGGARFPTMAIALSPFVESNACHLWGLISIPWQVFSRK